MGGQYLWYLLVFITTQSFFLIASASSCAAHEREIVMLICDNYSCRNKCNVTMDELLRNGTQQWCHCDERCVMLNDCCHDFASLCNDMLRQSTGNHPKFVSSCFHKDISVINGFLSQSGSSTASTSTEISDTSSPATGTTNYRQLTTLPNQVKSPSWAEKLHYISQAKIDHDRGLLFSSQFLMDSTWHVKFLNLTPIEVVTASLEANKHFSSVEYLSESNPFLSLHSLGSAIPKNIKRNCLGHYLNCPDCSHFILPEYVCETYTETSTITGNSRNCFLDTSKELGVGNESCTMHFFHEDQRYRMEQSLQVHQAKVTVIPDHDHGSSTIISQHLPWASIQCKQLRQITVLCEIQSCAVDRLLSPDGRACFIPTSISVLVDEPVKPVDDWNATRLRQRETGDQKMKFQQNACLVKRPASYSLCLALYRMLDRHTGWAFEKISSRQTCRYYFKIRSTLNNNQRDGSLEMSELYVRDNATSDSSSSKSNGLTPNSYQDNGNASQTNNSNNNSNATIKPRGNADRAPYIQVNHEDEMQQAWNIVYNNLDTLPVSEDLRSLQICLESEPKYPSHSTENPETCEDRMSKCLLFKLIEKKNSIHARTVNSSYRHLPCTKWIHLIFILYVFENLTE